MTNRFRALRNLALAAVLLLAAWFIAGAPIPVQLGAMRMHRAERECLLPRSEIVWRHHISEDPPDTLVGVTPTAVHTYHWDVEVWDRDPDGPTLVPLPSYLSYTAGVGGTGGLLAVDPPAGAESARLTVTLETWYSAADALYSEEYQAEGVRDGECFLFPLTCHHRDTKDPLRSTEYAVFQNLTGKSNNGGYFTVPYTLEFFDGDGNLILSCGNQT